jgi:polyisoprenoid-binding protein YceI
VKLSGDSTLKKFTSSTNHLTIQGYLETIPSHIKDILVNNMDFKVTIPVMTLESGDKTLDKHMMKALKADKFPIITVILKRIEHKTGVVAAVVDLTIAGTTKEVYLETTATIEGDNLRVVGKKPLLMTDFGIEPPSLFLGTIKTRNEITIDFNVLLTLQK